MTKALLMTAMLMLAPLPALSQGMQGSDDRDNDSSYGRRGRDIEELLRGMDEDGGYGAGARRGAGRGAGFLMRSGDATVAVRCDPRDSMRACVDATLSLLERARTMAPPSGGGGGGGAPPGGTPPTR
jgi:hypothetical protein